MKQKETLILCDADERYVSSLAEYMNSRPGLSLYAEPFTDPEKVREYLQNHSAGILLAGRSDCEALISDESREEVFCILLAEKQEDNALPQVRKYQSADSLIRQVLDLYAYAKGTEPGEMGSEKMEPEEEAEVETVPGKNAPGADHTIPDDVTIKAKLLAVYSPVGRCGKTSFAITLGEQLAGREHVLYLNLEDCSGFASLLDLQGEGDLSDLLYFAKLPGGSLLYKLNALTRTWDKLDYIPPVFSCEDLREMSGAEWCRFLNRLSEEGGYDTIILDIGTQVQEVFRLLRLCDQVFVPVLEDPVSKGKLRQFTENMEVLGGKKLQERVRYLQLPAGKEDKGGSIPFPECVTRGRMGDYVKRMLRNR